MFVCLLLQLVLGIASMLPLRAAHAGQSSSSKATKKSTKAPPDYCTAVGACAMCDPLTEGTKLLSSIRNSNSHT